MFTCPFRIQRLTLIAGTLTPITPPVNCSSVTVSNRTTGDLEVHSDDSGTDYGIISSCFEEQFNLSQSGSATALYRTGQINFYLNSIDGGLVVLTWT